MDCLHVFLNEFVTMKIESRFFSLTLFAGGVISWLVLMPAIRFFGSLSPNAALYPSTVPIPQMTPDMLWASYIRPMGAGAVAASGLITLILSLIHI